LIVTDTEIQINGMANVPDLGVGPIVGRLIVTDTEIQINGMAHVILCVSDFGAARKFYERLLPALRMTPVCDTNKLLYCVGGRTAIGIQPADSGERFVQGRVGLHHLYLRALARGYRSITRSVA
jgi:hypothetical protein